MGSEVQQVLQSEPTAVVIALDGLALAHEAEEALEKAAYRIDAWGKALPTLTLEDLKNLRATFEREAQKLRNEAKRIVAIAASNVAGADQ